MPRQTFFNIPLAKQKLILDIAREEFTSKTFEDVSIKTIAKKADISRGSFYTYFDNLDELFNYIIKQVKEDRLSYAKDIIKESKGDYFVFIKKLFAHDFDSFKDSNRYSLFRNYIRYSQFSRKGTLKSIIHLPFEEDKNNISDMFNLDSYNISKEELIDLFEVIFLIMTNTFFKSETHNLSKEEVIALFERRISIIEKGVKTKINEGGNLS